MENRLIKILAIDDNPDNLITIQALIHESYPKFLVLKALNGIDGIKIAADEYPDVILLDIVMPELDGYEVCKRLKADKNLSDIPVIFVTAIKGDKESRIKALEYGAEAFLAKPIDESELIAQIRAMVKIKSAHLERQDENVRLAALVAERTLELRKTHTATLNLLEDLKKEIEAREKTEAALRESEELYRSVLNASPDDITVTDLEGKILMISPVGVKLFGYTNQTEIIGKMATDFIISKDNERALNNLLLMFNGQFTGPEEYRLLKADGSEFDSEINAEFVRDIHGNPKGIVFAIRDITERKQAQESLIESEEKFREMTNLLPQIVFELDIQGNLTYLNRQAYKIFGYSEEDDLIETNSIRFDIPNNLSTVIEKTGIKIENKPFGSSFYTMTRKDGTTFPALIYSNPVIKDFKPIGTRGIIVDITEQKIAEEKISHIARLYALLSQTNHAITRTQGKNELYQKICEVAVEFGQFQMAWVGMYDDSTNKIIPITWAGYNEEYLDQITITTGFDILGIGPTGTAFHEGKITVCNDIATDPMMLPWRDEALKRGYKSVIAMPFVRNEQMIGTLTLYASETNFFSVDELSLMKELSDDISFAINAIDTENLRNQTEKELEQSRNELKAIYDHAPVMMCVVDINRNVLFANQAFSNLTGISEIEMIGGAVGNVVGCINSLLDPRGCGYGPNCWKCNLRTAMEKTFSTGIGNRNIEYHSTLNIAGSNLEVSLLGSTAMISNDEKKSLLLCLHDITDRKLAEEALQKSEMLLRTFIENSPFEIWARDINNVGILENKKTVDHYGTIIGKKPTDIININHGITQFWHTNNERVLEGRIVDEEFEHFIDNSKHIYQQIAFPINNNEKTIGIAGFNIDITESKKIEEALRQNNSRLELAMQISNMSWWEMDTITGNILSGKRKTEMLGYNPSDFKHYNDFMKLVHPDDYEPAMNAMRNHLQGLNDKYETEYRILTSEEHYRWFYDIGSISKRDTDGKPLIVSGLVMDITDRKEVEKELSDQKQFFEQMFMQSSLSTQILDQEGWCERINPKLTEIFGVDANNIEGKLYNIFKDKEIQLQGVLQKLENVFKYGKTEEWEVLFDIGVAADSSNIVVADKKKVWFSNWAYPIFSQNGEISHVIIQHNDITDRKIVEQALSESQEQLKKFAAHLQNVREEERVLLAREIHDELGQILIAIKIDMGMLKQNVMKNVDKKQSELILTKFDVLFSLVDNTIKTARKIMTDLRPEVLDLLGFTEAIKQHLKAFQDRFNILCVFDNSIKSIDLDSQKSVALFRIIQEALNNIAKHSKATKVIVTTIQNENQLSLEITDNGIGFDENNKKNPDSYGLIGMKERVFLLDGELTITSKKDVGTTIKVVMPYLASSIEH